jgi:uncharacterized protein YjiS (DUF1127 family)
LTKPDLNMNEERAMTNATNRDPLNGRDVSDLMVLGNAARAEALAAAAGRTAGYLAGLARRGYGAVAAVADRAFVRIDRARKRRAVINQLGVLSDATLKDIGFHRSQLGSVAHDLLEGDEPAPAIRRRPPCEVVAIASADKAPAGSGAGNRIAA